MATRITAHASTTYRPVFNTLLARVRLAYAAWRQRRALAELDDAALRDLGLTRTQALTEAHRPIWDVPQHWLR